MGIADRPYMSPDWEKTEEFKREQRKREREREEQERKSNLLQSLIEEERGKKRWNRIREFFLGKVDNID